MKPSHYNAKSFHGVRFISALSAIVVTSILVFFCIQLKSDGFKIPWTFLVCLLTTALTLITLILTLSIHLCTRLSPLLNLILNIPLLILHLISTALLTWNIYGTLAHSYSLTNWGNNDGVNVCQQYKILFSFLLFGLLAQIGAVVVDIRARIAQNRSGSYAKMRESNGSTMKLEPYDSTHAIGHSHNNTSQSTIHDAPYVDAANQYRDQESTDGHHGWRPGQRSNTNASTFATASSRYSEDIGGRVGQQQFRTGGFGGESNDYYTGYSSAYGQGQGQGHGYVGHRY